MVRHITCNGATPVQARGDGSPWQKTLYTAAIVTETGSAECYLDIRLEVDFVGVHWLDAQQQEQSSVTFEGGDGYDGRLFLTHYLTKPADGEWISLRFSPDGLLRMERWDPNHEMNVRHRFHTRLDPADLEPHWEPIPLFGDYASIIRRPRSTVASDFWDPRHLAVLQFVETEARLINYLARTDFIDRYEELCKEHPPREQQFVGGASAAKNAFLEHGIPMTYRGDGVFNYTRKIAKGTVQAGIIPRHGYGISVSYADKDITIGGNVFWLVAQVRDAIGAGRPEGPPITMFPSFTTHTELAAVAQFGIELADEIAALVEKGAVPATPTNPKQS